jgi:hypothetical protein
VLTDGSWSDGETIGQSTGAKPPPSVYNAKKTSAAPRKPSRKKTQSA